MDPVKEHVASKLWFWKGSSRHSNPAPEVVVSTNESADQERTYYVDVIPDGLTYKFYLDPAR
jgi:hypothetical protein